MKTESINTYQKSPNFGAIRVPVSEYSKKFNPGVIMDVMKHHIPDNKIKICRGQTKTGELVDYIMLKFTSVKEIDIFKELAKLNKKVQAAPGPDPVRQIERFEKLRSPLDNSTHIFGVDASPDSGVAREMIRERLLEKTEAIQKLSGGRLSEFEFKKMLKNLSPKESNIDDEKMCEIVDKFRIYNGQCVQKNGYIGGMLRFKQDALPELKAAGIKTIINLEYFDEGFERACHDAGLEHIYLDIPNPYEDSYVFRPKKDFFKRCKTPEQLQLVQKVYENTIKKEVENIIKLIETINKGNYYMGCNMCHERTPQALSFNRYFNPKDKTAGMTVELYYSFKEVKNLFTHFTDADKKRLGYTPEFIKRFEG